MVGITLGLCVVEAVTRAFCPDLACSSSASTLPAPPAIAIPAKLPAISIARRERRLPGAGSWRLEEDGGIGGDTDRECCSDRYGSGSGALCQPGGVGVASGGLV